MKKILFVLVLFFCFDNNVLGAEIIVDGISYNANKNFSGKGYSFDSGLKILYLDGYNGGVIEYTEKKLTISVSNDNYINGNGKEVGLNVLSANIYGSGSLNIFNSDIGILAERFQIQNINVLIMTKKYGIKATKDQVFLSNSKISIKNCEIGLYGTINVFLQDTTMNIIDCNYGIKGNNLNFTLNLSNFYVKTNDYSADEINGINVINSNVVFRSNLVALNDKYIVSRLGNVIYVSNDQTNYFQEKEYHYYPVVKVAHKDNIESLLFNENSIILDFDESFVNNDNKLEDNVDGNDSGTNSDNNLDVLTKNEYNHETYTKDEYTDNEFDNVEIINPNTYDNLNNLIINGLISIFLIISIMFFRRENE